MDHAMLILLNVIISLLIPFEVFRAIKRKCCQGCGRSYRLRGAVCCLAPGIMVALFVVGALIISIHRTLGIGELLLFWLCEMLSVAVMLDILSLKTRTA